MRACAPGKLITKNSTTVAHGLSYYRVGPAPPPCSNIKTKAECDGQTAGTQLCHWDGSHCTLPPPPPPSGPWEVTDVFKGVSLGIWHESFWAEVDESSMLLLRIACKKTSAARAKTTDEAAPPARKVHVVIMVESYCPCSGSWPFEFYHKLLPQIGDLVTLDRFFDASRSPLASQACCDPRATNASIPPTNVCCENIVLSNPERNLISS